MAEPVLAFERVRLGVEGGPREILLVDDAVGLSELVVVDAQEERYAACLAEAVVGLTGPVAGAVRFLGQNWRGLPFDYADALRGRIGWAPDDDEWLPHMPMDANLLLSQAHHTRVSPSALRDQAAALSVRFGLPGLPTGHAGELGALDRARAAFARAFLGTPRLILLGHPRRIPGELIPLVINAAREAREQDAAVLWFLGSREGDIGASIPATRRLNASVEGIESAHERGQVQNR